MKRVLSALRGAVVIVCVLALVTVFVLAQADGGKTGDDTFKLFNQAKTACNQGRFQDAIDLYKKALIIVRALDEPYAKGVILNNLGDCYRSLSDYQRAIDYYQQSLAISREIGDRSGEARGLNDLGNCYYDQGDYQRAIEYYQQSLAIRREIGDRRGEANSLNNLGLCYRDMGEYTNALELLSSSRGIYLEVGNELGLAKVSVWLGDCYRNLGRYLEAMESYSRALSAYREIGYRWGSFIVLLRIARLGSVLGPFREIIARYKEALGEVEGFPAPTPELTHARKLLYDTLIDYSPPEEALLYAERAKERAWLDTLEETLLSRPKALPGSFRPLRYVFLKLIGLYRALLAPGLNLEGPFIGADFVSMLEEAEGEYQIMLSRVLEGR